MAKLLHNLLLDLGRRGQCVLNELAALEKNLQQSQHKHTINIRQGRYHFYLDRYIEFTFVDRLVE